MQIKIGKVPGRTQVLELQEGATIAEAVRQAGLDVTGHELRFNGSATENFNKEVTDGAIVLLTPRIKGNMDDNYITVSYDSEEYVVAKGNTVRTLLSAAGVDIYEIEEDERLAIKKDDKWIAVTVTETLIPFGEYNIVDADDVEYPVRESVHTCNCGGNCGVDVNAIDSSTARIIVGGFEITVKKI